MQRETISAAKFLGLHDDTVEDHGKSHVQQSEKDRPVAAQQKAQQKGQDAGGQGTRENQEKGVVIADQGQHGGGIGADAEIQRVPKGNQARAPQYQ